MEKDKKNIIDIAASLRALDNKKEVITINTNFEEKESKLDISDFENIFENVKRRKFENNATIYVDEDVKEVLNILRTSLKMPLSSLVSHILEEWIEKNKEDIEKTINKNKSKNRFL